MKQGIVLSVFSGPILGGLPGRVPTQSEFIRGLRQLYPNYPTNRNNTNSATGPPSPFAGYFSPRLGEIFKTGPKLRAPFHDRLFFAGEHTHMAFFGYMEGALRSGERAQTH